jgi:signal transduction histidine kinase
VQNLLQLVMINLITNAFQAMSDGGELTVTVGLDKNILIEIHNTGPGIPETQLTKGNCSPPDVGPTRGGQNRA